MVPLEQVRMVIKIEIFKTRYNRGKLVNIIYVSIVWVTFNFSNKDRYKWHDIILRWSRHNIWNEYNTAVLRATVKKYIKNIGAIKHTRFGIIICNSTN